MKTKILILTAMSCTIVGFAQKDEIKSAEKALKAGDALAAKTALEGASSSIQSADAKTQAQYHYLRGTAHAELAKNGDGTAFDGAIESFNKVRSLEAAGSKTKYGAEIDQRMVAMTADVVNAAVTDNANENYKAAADKLYLAYTLSPQDTSYLYYAAGSSVTGGLYEDALKYYNDLKTLKYDGGGTVYKATNAATGEVEEMNKTQRDLMIKSGTYKDPVDEKTPSKKAEIVKNIALIYTQLGQDDKAIDAFKEARANDPKDVNLILSEANLFFKLGDKDKFKSLMAEAIAVAPDNADLYYNVGVINMEQDNIQEAREAYRKALEIDPGYTNAQLNLSTTYVNEGNGLVDEMNSLGNSRADIARYDVLKQKKDDLFREGAVILEDALKGNPTNQSILTQLKNIYGALGDNDNFLRVKKLLGE